MENQTSFDLSNAIGNWRRSLAQSAAFRQADLDELETHLRDAIPSLQAAGLSTEESFLIASRRIGPPNSLESEFRKVQNGPVWINRPWRLGLHFAIAFMILSLIGVAAAIETTVRRASVDFIQPPGLVSPAVFGVIVVVMAILGGIGYLALRLVSKSGSERLADIHAWPQDRRRTR